MNQCFPKSLRLLKTEEFQRVFAARCSVFDSSIILFTAPNTLSFSRLGLSVSRKIGNAVCRNRWKRLIREAFRRTKSMLPCGFDFVVIPQRHADVQNIQNLDGSLQHLSIQLVKRQIRKPIAVLLTRAEHQIEPVKSRLESLGFQVQQQPCIDILPPESWEKLDEAIEQLRRGLFDWLIFSSGNGVQMFFDRALNLGAGCCAEHVRIAAAGNGTDAVLYQKIGRNADAVPKTFTAEGIAEILFQDAAKEKRFLHIRADQGRGVLKAILSDAGGEITEIIGYRSVNRCKADPKIIRLMQQGKIDYVTVTSSAIAQSLVHMFGEPLRQTKLVSISPITSQTLLKLGFPPYCEADEASLNGVVQQIVQHINCQFGSFGLTRNASTR